MIRPWRGYKSNMGGYKGKRTRDALATYTVSCREGAEGERMEKRNQQSGNPGCRAPTQFKKYKRNCLDTDGVDQLETAAGAGFFQVLLGAFLTFPDVR